MVRFDPVMIRSPFLRLLAGLVLVSHALAMAGVCDCVAPPLEEATMAMSSCHEEESGLRISRPADCCCGDEQANRNGDALAASMSPGAGTAPTSLSSPAPPATAVLGLARPVQVMSGRGPSLPRPPLRV